MRWLHSIRNTGPVGNSAHTGRPPCASNPYKYGIAVRAARAFSSGECYYP
jgi:hypothetical protein